MNDSNDPHTKRYFHGYSELEVYLSGYIIFAILVATALVVVNQIQISKDDTPHYASDSRQDGKVSSNKPKSDPAPSSYTPQTFSGHDFKVALTFDPNAYGIVDYQPNSSSNGKVIPGSGNDELDIIGNPIGSTNNLIISVIAGAPGSGLIKASSSDMTTDFSPLFKATIMGTPYTIFTEPNPNLPNIIVNVQVKQTWFEIKILNYTRGGANASTPISSELVKSILQSMEIQ